MITLKGQYNTPSNIEPKKRFQILYAASTFHTPNEGYFPKQRSQQIIDKLKIKFNCSYKNGRYICT